MNKLKSNEHFIFKDEVIFSKSQNEIFSPYKSWRLFTTINDYFKTIYSAINTRASVLLLTDEDLNKLLYLELPELTLPYPFNTNLHCIIPPQLNTIDESKIPDKWLKEHIVDNNIVPMMKITSHHNMTARQAKEDLSNLNSGMLEVNIGKIFDEIPEIEWWLDKDNCQKHTFHN